METLFWIGVIIATMIGGRLVECLVELFCKDK
jgi:hypothetical protein